MCRRRRRVVSLLGKVTRVIEDATREKKKRRLCFQSTMGSFLQEEGGGQGRGKTRGFSSEKEGGVKIFFFFFVRNLPFAASIASRG